MSSFFDERQHANWGDFQSGQSPQMCKYASLLSEVMESLVADAERRRDLILVYEAKVVLLDKLVFIFNHAKGHRFGMGTMNHLCLWHVFLGFFDRLCIAEMALTTRLALPMPASPPPPPPQETKKHIVIAEVRE